MTDLDSNQNLKPDTEEAASNQTRFGEEEPLFERSSLPPVPADEMAAAPKHIPLWRQKKVFVVGAIFVVLFMILSLISLSQPQRGIQQILQVQTTPSPRPQQTALQTRLTEVKQDLNNADPSKLDLPYPPIDKTIEIDQPAQ